MPGKYCYQCGNDLSYPRYFCKACGVFYHWECLDRFTKLGEPQCPQRHGPESLQKIG